MDREPSAGKCSSSYVSVKKHNSSCTFDSSNSLPVQTRRRLIRQGMHWPQPNSRPSLKNGFWHSTSHPIPYANPAGPQSTIRTAPTKTTTTTPTKTPHAKAATTISSSSWHFTSPTCNTASYDSPLSFCVHIRYALGPAYA